MKVTNMKRGTNKMLYLVVLIGMALSIASCKKGEPPFVESYEPVFGTAETLITVKGSNLDDLISLDFENEVAADFNPSYGTDKALLFRVPANAPLGENNVKITTMHGETSFTFRVSLKPPEVVNFAPKSANAGAIVSIVGQNFFEPLEVLFFDSIPGNIIYSAEDSIAVEVPEGVEKGRLKVKANGGNAFTAEVFFTTKDILVNDFDGNGARSETGKWLFYGNIDQNSATAIQSVNPEPIDGNYMKISGVDPGSIWIGGSESHSNDPNDFDNFGIESDINNTFIEMDVHNGGADDTHLIIVLAERNGSPNDFTETIHLDDNGWQSIRLPLNRFSDISGENIDPSKIRTVKLHLYNELKVSGRLQANIDNLKFIQIN